LTRTAATIAAHTPLRVCLAVAQINPHNAPKAVWNLLLMHRRRGVPGSPSQQRPLPTSAPWRDFADARTLPTGTRCYRRPRGVHLVKKPLAAAFGGEARKAWIASAAKHREAAIRVAGEVTRMPSLAMKAYAVVLLRRRRAGCERLGPNGWWCTHPAGQMLYPAVRSAALSCSANWR
jgi:hypothetical protein